MRVCQGSLLRAELLARLGLAVVAARHVARDRRRIELGGIAEAAAARCRYPHHVADANFDVLVLGEVRRPVALAALAHPDGVGAAVLAAQYSLRPGAAVVHHHGDARLATAQLDRIVDAEATAELAGAARALAQRELLG